MHSRIAVRNQLYYKEFQSTLAHDTPWRRGVSDPNILFDTYTDTIHTDKHTKRFSHMTGPATCPLCWRSDSAPHMLFRYNNHTLKRLHMNRHHHAVSCCREEVGKSWDQQSLQWMLITVKRYLTVALNFLKETFLTGFSQHNITIQLDIKSRPDYRVSHAHWRKRQVFGPQTDSPKRQKHWSCRINPAQK